MAYNLDIAARQHIHLNGRTTRIRSALELNYMMQPHDTTTILHLGRFYMLHQMDVSELVIMLQNVQKDLETREEVSLIQPMLHMFQKSHRSEEEIQPKRRTSKVKYAVGLIMTHKVDDNLCVITGWNTSCQPPVNWHQIEDSENLDQPFYNAFVDDGSSRYVPQEYLLLSTRPRMVNHYQIGHYFRCFKETHYVPNEETSKEYPEDKEALENILKTYLN